MKKLAFILCCLSAHSVYANHHPFSGLYATGAVGAMSGKFHVNQNAVGNFSQANIDLPSEYDLSAASVVGMLGVGYSYQFDNHFVLGLSLLADYSNLNADNTAKFELLNPDPSENNPNIYLINRLESRLSNDFAALFKLGYVFGHSTQFYGLIGPRWGNFQSATSIELLVDVGTPVADFQHAGSTFQYELGLSAGLGIQQHVSEQWYLGLEYLFTTYGDIDAPNASTQLIFGEPIGYLTDDPSISVNTNSVMLTLTYQW